MAVEADAAHDRQKQQRKWLVRLGVSVAVILVFGIGILIGRPTSHTKPAPMVPEDYLETQVVVVKGRQAGCDIDDFWKQDSVPKTIHIAVKSCDSDKRRMIWANIEGVDLSCFEIRCHSNVYKGVYVRRFFPEWVDFYTHLPQPAMQADIYRYLVLYKEGGFYMDDDVDVYPGFATNFERIRNETLIVGWERADTVPVGTWCGEKDAGMLCNSLATFAIGAQAGAQALIDVVKSSEEFFRVNKTTGNASQDLLTGTGPVRFSSVVLPQLPVGKVLWLGAFGCRLGGIPCDNTSGTEWLHHRNEGYVSAFSHSERVQAKALSSTLYMRSPGEQLT